MQDPLSGAEAFAGRREFDQIRLAQFRAKSLSFDRERPANGLHRCWSNYQFGSAYGADRTPGSILIPADTLALAEGYIQSNRWPAAVRGIANPIEVFEVMGAGTVRTRMEASAARGLTPFVGRETEIQTLNQALERARGGRGQVVALVGEPGVGKSRLFWEFIHSHRTHGWLVLEGGTASFGKSSVYLAVIDLLKAYFQIEPRDDTRKIREKVTGKILSGPGSGTGLVGVSLPLERASRRSAMAVARPTCASAANARRTEAPASSRKSVQPLGLAWRICTGSILKRRGFWTAWSTAWQQLGCCFL